MIRELRILPAMLRVGFVSAIAYRAELIVWMLTTNLPLINLALWTAVARDGAVGRYGQADFAAYFLCTLVVRLLTGCWVLWELTMEIRQGGLSMRLLRPIHPLWSHAASNFAALPMRGIIALPVFAVVLAVVGRGHLATDPVAWMVVPIAILGAWVLTFLVMAIIGSLSFFIDSAFAIFEVWLGLFTVLSGYLVPLELFPDWLQTIAQVLPFRLLLGFPVEAMLGHLSRSELLLGLLQQALWMTALLVVLRSVWSAGLRRHAAFGG